MNDRASAKVRERVFVEKFDHETDPPRHVETVVVENGQVISRESVGSEDKTSAAWRRISIIARSAHEAGLDLDVAMKFLSILSMNFKTQGLASPVEEQ